MCMPPLFAPPQRIAEPIPSLPPFFPPPEISSFWETSIAITRFGTQELLPTPVGRKYSTGSSPQTSSPQWSWHTHPSPSLLSWHFLCSFYSCSWQVLQDLGSDHLPILLSVPLSPVFRPNECPSSFNFQKARWDGFASYFDSHCPSAEEYSSLSLSSAAALFTSLALNAAKSSIAFGRIKRPPKAWWSAEVEQAVGERRRAFATAHRSDEDRQAYISASQIVCSPMFSKFFHLVLNYTATWFRSCFKMSCKPSLSLHIGLGFNVPLHNFCPLLICVHHLGQNIKILVSNKSILSWSHLKRWKC